MYSVFIGGFRRILGVFGVICILMPCAHLVGQTYGNRYQIDTRFSTSLEVSGGAVRTVMSTAGGGYYVGGLFSRIGGLAHSNLARFNADGTPDATFAANAGFDNFVDLVAVQGDNRVLAAGTFTMVNGVARKNFARLNADGTLDAAFNPTIVSDFNYGYIQSIALQPDGRIIVGGHFSRIAGGAQMSIARLNADGTLDATFNPGAGFHMGIDNSTGRSAPFEEANVFAVALQPDGRLLVGGDFKYYNGVAVPNIVRLNANGSLDTTFNLSTPVALWVYAIAVQSDGRIVAGGYGASNPGLARLNADGSLDATFSVGTGFSAGGGETVESLVIQLDGRIVAGGDFTSYNGTTCNNIVRLNVDGTLDTGFGAGGGFSSTVYSLGLQADGRILAGGYFAQYGNLAVVGVARLTTTGALDTTLLPVNLKLSRVATSLLPLASGKYIVMGSFNSVNGTARPGIARLNTDGSLDTAFNPGTGFSEPGSDGTRLYPAYVMVEQQDGRIVVGGQFARYNGTACGNLARLNTDGTMDMAFNSGAGFALDASSSVSVLALCLQSDGRIIAGGNFTSFNGTARSSITRLNTDGSLDTTFNPGTGFVSPGIVYAMSVQPDGRVLVGGSFDQFNGTSRKHIARLNADGTLDTTFAPGTGFYTDVSLATSKVRTITLQPDGRIVAGGQFSSFDGTLRKNAARLNANGTLDATFNPGSEVPWEVTTTALQADGRIVVGGALYSSTELGLKRLNADGSRDTGFSVSEVTPGNISKVFYANDGRLHLVGQSASAAGVRQVGMAVLTPDFSSSSSSSSGSSSSGPMPVPPPQPINTTAGAPDNWYFVAIGVVVLTRFIWRKNSQASSRLG